MEIDLPEVHRRGQGRVRRAMRRRWSTNDVAVLDELFRNDPRTLRYGIGENLYGYEAITAFAPRARRSG